METWLMYAIMSVFAAGFFNFTMKIAAERNYNVSTVNMYSYIVWIILGLSYFLLSFDSLSSNNVIIVIVLGFVNTLFFVLSLFSRVKSMQNIDSVIFFPLYKTFGPIVAVLISFFFFKETLEPKQILGIIAGIFVPLLLITKAEKKIQKNLFIGIVFILITTFLTSVSSGMCKEVIVKDYSLPIFTLTISISGLLFSFVTNNYKKHKNGHYNKAGVFKFSIIAGILHFFSFLFFIKALEGNYAVVFTINSFSILIPIILSIIFYKEHWNLRKAVVITLSIISILLFI